VRPVDKLLSRLDRVTERSGGQYLACCPAHEDKSPSLSIKEVDGGRVLVYCFAGCTAAEVCASVGLELRDLFRVGESQQRYQVGPRLSHGDLLALLATEANVVYLAADMLYHGKELSEQDRNRLEGAWSRIYKITGEANVSR
jgi:hypothetical protein